jgi:hypothetical protein
MERLLSRFMIGDRLFCFATSELLSLSGRQTRISAFLISLMSAPPYSIALNESHPVSAVGTQKRMARKVEMSWLVISLVGGSRRIKSAATLPAVFFERLSM